MNKFSQRYNIPASWQIKSPKSSTQKFYKRFFEKFVFMAFVLLAFIVAPLLILYWIKEAIREKITLHFRLNETLPAIRHMKEVEEKNKFAAMQKVLHKHKIDLSIATPDEIARDYTESILLDHNKLIADGYKRQIVKELSRQTSFSTAWLQILAAWTIPHQSINEDGTVDYDVLLETEIKSNDEVLAALKALLFLTDQKKTIFAADLTAKMHRTSNKLTKMSLRLESHLQEFKKLFEEMLWLLKDPKELRTINPTQANRTFIRLYRHLLQHPIYTAFKQDPTLAHVSLLHDFACAIWNDVHVLTEYKAVGKAIIFDASLQANICDPLENSSNVAYKLSSSQACVARLHHANDTLISKIRYGSTHFWQMMGTLASEGGILRLIPMLLGAEDYDAHGKLSNNPSLQGTTQWEGLTLKGAVNNCYGGTPTIGDHQVAPEFKAFLQAIENNLLDPDTRNSKQTPSKVIYNNLQNIDKFHGEGPRSRTLMKLNETYPLSFKGTILAKDSALFTMKSTKDVVWENAKQFGAVLKERLLLGVNSPEKAGHGFYFFGSSEKWEIIFNAIIEAVNSQFVDVPTPLAIEERISLQGAYQEYVYALLICVIECQTIQELNAAGIEYPLVTAITACKENIDRGGMENMKYMYLRLPFADKDKRPLSNDEQLDYLVGVMNSRPLSARDRAILKNRMHQTLSFIEKVTPEQFNRTLEALLTALNLTARLTYAPDTTFST